MGATQTLTLMNESKDTDAIRSDIDQTRQRMDDTMDEIGNRLQGRHLLDEILGLFRGNGNADGEGGGGSELREKISRTASNAANSVMQTVKENPLPALVIGAGIAWMLYESRKDKGRDASAYDTSDEDGIEYDPDMHYDRPLEY